MECVLALFATLLLHDSYNILSITYAPHLQPRKPTMPLIAHEVQSVPLTCNQVSPMIKTKGESGPDDNKKGQGELTVPHCDDKGNRRKLLKSRD
jgi:hypothetical protein